MHHQKLEIVVFEGKIDEKSEFSGICGFKHKNIA